MLTKTQRFKNMSNEIRQKRCHWDNDTKTGGYSLNFYKFENYFKFDFHDSIVSKLKFG